MEKNEIKIGRHYTAKVSNRMVTIHVDDIGRSKQNRTVYHVTNLDTGRKLVFKSVQRFIKEVTVRSDERHPDPCQSSEVSVAPANGTPDLRTVWNKAKGQTTEDSPHLIVEARAGTGKTTTLVESLKLIKGLDSKLSPSPQQKEVWDCINDGDQPGSVCFVSFSVSIVDELKDRVPEGCEAMTMHRLGNLAVTRSLGRQDPGKHQWVVPDILADMLNVDLREFKKKSGGLVILNAVNSLVSLCKQNLVGHDPHLEVDDKKGWKNALTYLSVRHGVDLNGQADKIFSLVPHVLEICKQPTGRITYDDMIWLPIVLNLPVDRFDLLLVDEAQDLNRCQQELALRVGRRIILCGDPKQAIYGFAGADSRSMARLEDILTDKDRGCVTLPLTVTRRCGKVIVKEAQKIVKDFEAHESNGEGKISRLAYPEGGETEKKYLESVQDGDFILCRTNAPLVTHCFKFISKGRKANIQGRDVGRGLISTVKKISRDSQTVPINEFIIKLDSWYEGEYLKESKKKHPSETRLQGLEDRHACLLVFCGDSDIKTSGGVIRKIQEVFTDDKTIRGIRLSSIHRAKGLEAPRVFFLKPPKQGLRFDKMQDWELEQESNLEYVAITRAIEELIYVN